MIYCIFFLAGESARIALRVQDPHQDERQDEEPRREGFTIEGAKRLPNAFWEQPLVDIYQQCRPDIMHSLAIGMDDHIISAIVYALSDSLRIETGQLDRTGRPKTILPWTTIGHIWNSNAQQLLSDYEKHNCGLETTEFVRTRLGKVFTYLPKKPGSMQAVEYETLLMLMPFALDNLFPELIVKLRKKGVEYENKTPGRP